MDYINKDEKKQVKKLQLIYGDCALGIGGKDFHYIFSYQFAGPESLVIDGNEWLYRVPKPTFWRATTDNDRGNKFPLRSGMWLSADMFIDCVGIRVFVDDKEIELPLAPMNNQYSEQETAQKVKLIYTYQTITVPATMVEVTYEVSADGAIEVKVHYHGRAGLPELPVFGMRFIVPTKAAKYRYEGLSGETYPDRQEGGIPGIYEIDGLPVTPYLVPQDCNVHVDTKWLEVYRNSTLDNTRTEAANFGLRFYGVGQNFAFSCIPYTAEELENATHQEELPAARRTVISILGAVRGVGGINSWGADVESPYHIDASKDFTFSFGILKLY
jgi:beta-galactosidase